ncbi:hypothetical protein Esti_001971 [Eimeria stiedai]|uniref:Surface antigen 8 n=1 Tax=Eimeria stiedai TaxID=471275 RepID=A0A6H0C2W1_9EIME|nr:surface antigen 8 [Eimeria stiedai]
MWRSSLLLFTAASHVLVDFSAASQEKKKVVRLADANSCLTDLNAARHDAGLAALTTETQDEKFDKVIIAEGFLKSVCDTLLDGKPFAPSQEDLPGATSALFSLGEGDEKTAPQCGAAVKHWQKGYDILKGDPPVDRKVELPEITAEGVSFVTLYNPTVGARGQCVVAACTERPKTGSEEDEDEDQDEGEELRNAQPDSKMVSALLCLTAPVAFNNNPLFT